MPTNWLLPESIADVLPSEARKIEELRRRMLDLFRTYGYELVMPPMLEYIESLLSGTGHDLDLKTFKLVDQLSGRTIGLRADITPQVARIDAHLLNRAGVTRLCYAGSVLHTRPSGFHVTREPLQIGAEIYGHAGLEADLAPAQTLEPRHHVGRDRFVGVADMRRAVGIGYCRSEIIGVGHRALSNFRIQAASLFIAADASKLPISMASRPGSKL